MSSLGAFERCERSLHGRVSSGPPSASTVEMPHNMGLF